MESRGDVAGARDGWCTRTSLMGHSCAACLRLASTTDREHECSTVVDNVWYSVYVSTFLPVLNRTMLNFAIQVLLCE